MFLLAIIILLLTQGPAVVYIVAHSLYQGGRAGFVSILSIEAVNCFHVRTAAIGLSAILLSSALAFSIVKYHGGLFGLSWHAPAFFTRTSSAGRSRPAAKSAAHIFPRRPGSNPQPQDSLVLLRFSAPICGAVTMQLLAFGGMLVLMAIVTDGLYALLAGSIG